MQQEHDAHPVGASKRQILGILVGAIGGHIVMAGMHAHVNEGRQQQRDSEKDVPDGFETRKAEPPQVANRELTGR